MKQENANKLMAVFMAFIMVGSIGVYLFSRTSDTSQTDTGTAPVTPKYNPGFWTIDEPFYSIADALKMTPEGVTTAYFVDTDSMTPRMEQWVRGPGGFPIIKEVDNLYKSKTTKMYYANIGRGENRSFLLLSTMFPEKNDFGYVEIPNSYPPILKRTDLNNTYNVMGNPVILASGNILMDVLNITTSLNETATAYDNYKELFGIVKPASFQIMNSSVNFADDFYMGIRDINGSYERTTAYKNINQSLLGKLELQKTNSTERGFSEYNITRTGNYTVVRITSNEFRNVLNEKTS